MKAADENSESPTTPPKVSRSWAAMVTVKERPEILLVPLFAVLLFGGWEFLCRTNHVSDLILPTPSRILTSLYQGIRSGLFVTALKTTLIEIVLGFLLAAVSSFVIGTIISQVRLLELTLYPYIVAVQTLPKVAVAPLILIWVGLGIEGKIIVDLLRSLSASRGKIFRYVQLPEALPYIFTGMNIGLVLSVLGAIIGEFIGAKSGMGYLILQMNYNMDISGMFAALVLLAAMGIFLNFIAQFIRRKVVFWRPDTLITH
jgi:NitT/TauT family transport system permease protein